MPRLVNTAPGNNGTSYTYDIQGSSCEEVAKTIMGYADEQFSFWGRLQGQTQQIEPNMIDGVIKSGGDVAASCSYNGVPVNVMFQGLGNVCIIPQNGSQSVADELVGAGFTDFDDPYADFDTAPAGGLARGPRPNMPPDPRGGSRPPASMDEFSDAAPMDGSAPGAPDPGQTVGIGEWILTFILLAIPIVNIIFLIVWLVSKKTKKSKKNFLLAELIMMLIGIVLSGVLVFAFGAQLTALLQSSGLRLDNGVLVTDTNSGSDSGSPSNSTSVIENLEDDEYTRSGNSNNSNKNSNSNANSNANSNSNSLFADSSNANRADLSSAQGAGQADGIPALVVDINKADFQVLDDGNAVVIFTATAYNEGTDVAVPSDALRFSANQGVDTLSRATDGIADVFSPASIDTEIPANGSGVFQFAYYLAKDTDGNFNQQQVHVIIQNEYTLAQLAEGSY